MLLWLLIIISAYFVHLYFKQKHSIWRKQGVKGPAPKPILGNFTSIVFQTEAFSEYIKKIYKQYPDENIVGIYRGYQPMIVLKDPEIIKQVLIKDFHLFRNRGLTPSRGRVNENLVVAEDATWKILRQNLTPVFTSKKIKDMFLPLQKCSDNCISYIEQIIDQKNELEIKQIIEKYCTQATTRCAFGVDINPFNDKGHELNTITRTILTTDFSTKLSLTLDVIFPGIRKYIYTNLKAERSLSNLFSKIIEQKANQPQRTKDFMDLILHLRQQGKLNRRGDDGVSEIVLDHELMVAQVAVFYIAGVEPTSWLIAYILHELSLNQAIQNRLYEEICEVTKKHQDQFSYNAINEMVYLDMVMNETLRRYPVASTIFRKSEGDYTLPGSGVIIPKNTSVIVSIGAIQNDPKYFANPDIFDPENFSPDNRKKIPQCVDLAFGEGPRNCIGMRFAVVVTKIAIAAFIKKFKVSTSPKTKLDFDLEKFSLILSSKDGVWLNVSKR